MQYQDPLLTESLETCSLDILIVKSFQEPLFWELADAKPPETDAAGEGRACGEGSLSVVEGLALLESIGADQRIEPSTSSVARWGRRRIGIVLNSPRLICLKVAPEASRSN